MTALLLALHLAGRPALVGTLPEWEPVEPTRTVAAQAGMLLVAGHVRGRTRFVARVREHDGALAIDTVTVDGGVVDPVTDGRDTVAFRRMNADGFFEVWQTTFHGDLRVVPGVKSERSHLGETLCGGDGTIVAWYERGERWYRTTIPGPPPPEAEPASLPLAPLPRCPPPRARVLVPDRREVEVDGHIWPFDGRVYAVNAWDDHTFLVHTATPVPTRRADARGVWVRQSLAVHLVDTTKGILATASLDPYRARLDRAPSAPWGVVPARMPTGRPWLVRVGDSLVLVTSDGTVRAWRPAPAE